MKFNALPGPIRAVTFDLDDTLYNNAPCIGAAEIWFADLLSSRYHLPTQCREVSFWKIHKARTQERQPELGNDVTLLRAQALVDTFAFLGCPLKGGLQEGLALTYEFIARRSQVRVPESTFAFLAAIRRLVPIAALSNGNIDLQAAGLQGIFAFDLRPSLQPGCRAKPHPDLYLQAAARFGIRPQELLHVGDESLTDVQGAKNAGVQCAWLKGGIAGLSSPNLQADRLPEIELQQLDELLDLLCRPGAKAAAELPGGQLMQ